MSESRRHLCPECGKILPESGAHGLCPACLMGEAMKSRTFDTRGGAEMFPPPAPEEIAGKFPQFDVVECLGRGGMGVVYKARQKSLDRWVAIKVLAPGREEDAAFASRFESEAKTLAQMSHPNIVMVFDHGQTGGLYYIVMEYVDGVNLRDLLREGKMAPEQALAIVPPVCEALEYAHGKGVVHRDIKPENVLLDREGRVKIADFGIASLVGGSGEKSGTPPYMAPEQETGSVDKRADIYALGVVLYEMLTGERPTKDVVAPSRRVEVDVRIDEMVLRALEKEPERRYQTAGEFRTVVETLSEAMPRNAGGGTPGVADDADISQAELDAFTADPANWRWGIFYYCRQDPRIVVPKRINGLGWTVNLANAWWIPFVAAIVLGILGAVRLAEQGGVEKWMVVVVLLLGLVGVSHWMSRGPVPRHGNPPVMVRSAITAFLALGLASLLWPFDSGHAEAGKLSKEGWRLWQSGRLAEARERFEEAVKLRPDDASAWNGLGWVRFNSGSPDEGEVAFEKVLELDSEHPAALNGIGQIALSKRNDEKAEKYLLKAAERNATAAWFGLARLYLLQGKFKEAEKWAAKLEDSPDRSADSKRLLDAARAGVVPAPLKRLIDPDPVRESASSASPPTVSTKVASRRVVFETEKQGQGDPAELEALFRDDFGSEELERDLFQRSGREPVDLTMTVDALPAPGRFAVELECVGEDVVEDLSEALESLLDSWGEEHGVSFRRVDGEPVVEPVQAADRTAEKVDPAPSRAQVLIEDMALRMIVAIREKDDDALKAMAADRIKGWRESVPTFALELRERYRQVAGKPGFELRPGESKVKDDLGVVRCVGGEELGGKCVVMFFVKTEEGWKHGLLRISTEDVPLDEHLGYLTGQLEAAEKRKKSDAAESKEEGAEQARAWRYVMLLEEVAALKAGGVGEAHPQMKEAVAKLETLRKLHPELPGEGMTRVARARLTELRGKLEDLRASGLGEDHPKTRPLKARIAALEEVEAGRGGGH